MEPPEMPPCCEHWGATANATEMKVKRMVRGVMLTKDCLEKIGKLSCGNVF